MLFSFCFTFNLLIIKKKKKKCAEDSVAVLGHHTQGTTPKLPYHMKFSQHVYFAIFLCAYFATLKCRDHEKFYILNHSLFAFLRTTIFISKPMLFNMSLN